MALFASYQAGYSCSWTGQSSEAYRVYKGSREDRGAINDYHHAAFLPRLDDFFAADLAVVVLRFLTGFLAATGFDEEALCRISNSMVRFTLGCFFFSAAAA